MVALNEVIIDWSAESTSGGLSVLYFLNSGAITDQREGIQNMLGAVIGRLDSLTTWSVRTSGKVIDDATGTLTGFWSDSTARTGVGTVTGQPVANAAQVLLRWRTDNIVAGRLLQGRTYVPGLAQGATDKGQLAAATITAFQGGQAALLATAPGELVVWHRPTESTPGSSFPVTAGATWEELAVQRRRRA